MNAVQLVGIVGREPEMRITATGKKRCYFVVGCKRSHNRDQIDWVRVVAWDQCADFVMKWFHKGDHIGIVGKLRVDRYTGNDGESREDVFVVVDTVEFVERPKQN